MAREPRSFETRTVRRHLRILAAVALAVPGTVHAYDFRPTPSEWAAWPDYCKARYVTVPIANQTPYVRTVPPAAIETWKKRLGPVTFDSVHHYCASLVYVQRASWAPSAQERKHLLHLAESDAAYTMTRLPVTSPLYRQVAGHLQFVQSMRQLTP